MADKRVNLDLGLFYGAVGHEVLMERYDHNASVYDKAMEAVHDAPGDRAIYPDAEARKLKWHSERQLG